MNSVRPPNKEMGILAEGFFGQQSMIRTEWINWAIEYTHSDLPKVSMYVTCNLVSYYDYCQVLQRACSKYLVSENII